MKIKYKALLIVGSSAFVLIVLTYIIFNLTYFGYINKQQQQAVNRDFEVVEYIFDNEKDNLKATLMDWAYWDDTYEFIDNSNTKYIESNLMDSTLETLDLKMMIFLNADGDVFYSKALHLENGIEEVLTELVTKHAEDDEDDEDMGLFLIKDKAFIIAATHVTDSEGELQSNGALIFVREIGENMLDYIQNVAGVTVKFSEYNSRFMLSEDMIDAQESHGFIEADRVVKDIKGNTTIVISIVKELKDLKEITFYFNTFIKYFLILIGVIAILISIISCFHYKTKPIVFFLHVFVSRV